MKRSHPCAIRDRSRQFCEFLAKEANPPPIGYATTLLVVRRVQIAALAFGDLDHGMVVFARDLHDEVIDASWPYFEASICRWTFGRHYSMKTRVPIAAARCVLLDLCAEVRSTARVRGVAGIRDDAARVVVKASVGQIEG